MSRSALSRRYAQALIELAQEGNNVDGIGEEIKDFSELLYANDKVLAQTFTNPSVTEKERKGILNELLNRLEFSVTTSNFLHLLMDKHRISLFGDIVMSYQHKADELSGRKRAVVTTAQALTQMEERSQIRTSLAQAVKIDPSKLIIQFNVDKEILGGIIARVDDDIYDASIRSRLQDIRSSLL
jgi:F-type H+-transporting ATPase subunit delta